MSRIEGNKTSIQNALFFLKVEATIEDVRSLVASLALPGDTVFSAYKAIQDHTTALPNLLLDYLFNDFEDDEKLVGEISRHLFAKNRYRAAERFVRTSLLLNHGKPMTHRILGVVMIELNARYLKPADIPEQPGLVTMDVSFISATKLLPAIAPVAAPGADFLILIKPQFELEKGEIGKGGIVRDAVLHQKAIERVRKAAVDAGLEILGVQPSRLTGAEGNQEFFLHARRQA